MSIYKYGAKTKFSRYFCVPERTVESHIKSNKRNARQIQQKQKLFGHNTKFNGFSVLFFSFLSFVLLVTGVCGVLCFIFLLFSRFLLSCCGAVYEARSIEWLLCVPFTVFKAKLSPAAGVNQNIHESQRALLLLDALRTVHNRFEGETGHMQWACSNAWHLGFGGFLRFEIVCALSGSVSALSLSCVLFASSTPYSSYATLYRHCTTAQYSIRFFVPKCVRRWRRQRGRRGRLEWQKSPMNRLHQIMI